MTESEILMIGLGLLVVAAAYMYNRKKAAQGQASAFPGASPVQVLTPTAYDPIEQFHSALMALEAYGKRRGSAAVADQFTGVHAGVHQGFIQSALAPPAPLPPVPTPAPVPNVPASPAP